MTNRVEACERRIGADLRPQAAGRCGSQPGTANSKLHSGCSLRGTQVRIRTAGLRRREAAARRCLTASIFTQKVRSRAVGGVDCKELQPSARGVAADRCALVGANSAFKIQNYIRAAACGARKFGYELRASAVGRLRPANRCAIDIDSACGNPAAERKGGGRLRAAGRCRTAPDSKNSTLPEERRLRAAGPDGSKQSCGLPTPAKFVYRQSLLR